MQNQEFNLHCSTYYLTFLLILIVSCLLILILITIPIWLKILITLLVGMIWWQHYYQYGLLLGTQAIKKINHDHDMWFVYYADSYYQMKFQANSFISNYLLVLYLKNMEMNTDHVAIILPDSLTASYFQQLKMRLLLAKK